MLFSTIMTAAILASSAVAANFARRPPSCLPGRHCEVPKERRATGCNHDNVFRALLGHTPDASSFCSTYLGGATVYTTLDGTVTSYVVATATLPAVTSTVTDIITITDAPVIEAREAATPTLPKYLTNYSNATSRISSACSCLITAPVGNTQTVTIGSVVVTVSTTTTLPAPFVNATTFITTHISGTGVSTSISGSLTTTTSVPSNTTATPTPTSTPVCRPTPINGCVYGSSIITSLAITSGPDCTTQCSKQPGCLGYQIGLGGDPLKITFCELLNTDALDAFDASGTLSSSAYCKEFYIYDAGCPYAGFP